MGSLDKAFYRGNLAVQSARVVRTRLAKRALDHLPLVIDFHLAKTHPHAAHHAPASHPAHADYAAADGHDHHR